MKDIVADMELSDYLPTRRGGTYSRHVHIVNLVINHKESLDLLEVLSSESSSKE